MIKKLLLSLAFLAALVHADTLKSEKELQALVKDVMTDISKGETGKGLDLMAPYLIISKNEFEVTKKQILIQEPLLQEQFGKSLSTEYIRTDKVGSSLIRIIYLLKYEKKVMSWTFYFYKPKSQWVLNAFKSDENLEIIFN